MLLSWWKGSCNLEASFRRASTGFPVFGFPRGNTKIAGTRNTNWKSSHRNVFNSSLFHYIGNPHNRPRCWNLWRSPNATYRTPLFPWLLNCPPPIHSLIHTTTNLNHHLPTRCSLHLAPQFKNSTVGDAVKNSCNLSQHKDAKVPNKVSLGEMRTFHELLHAK